MNLFLLFKMLFMIIAFIVIIFSVVSTWNCCCGLLLLVFCQIHCFDCHWIYPSTVSHSNSLQSYIPSFSVRTLHIIIYLTIIFSYVRNKILQVTDDRVKTMSEVIKSMRIIKMYCWESAIDKKIRQVRK